MGKCLKIDTSTVAPHKCDTKEKSNNVLQVASVIHYILGWNRFNTWKLCRETR